MVQRSLILSLCVVFVQISKFTN